MSEKKLKRMWLGSEERQKRFIGWDFSEIEAQYWQEKNSWDYSEIVHQYLKEDMELLDMGTGGGELLKTFNHPLHKTSVTEGWKKNHELLLRTLKPKGVNVQFVEESDELHFSDNSFDIILNSHESFSIPEVKRVLKPNGIFISQQVGDMNGLTLASRVVPHLKKDRFHWHLSCVVDDLSTASFEVLYQNECYPVQKFYDMDALIYYARTISWEFPDFSVENNFHELLHVNEGLTRNGYVYSQQHRFVFVARLTK
ncbi:class I SAM-dependent methyltransferase [Enterococcus larvae]|uniref:class I SAM-dependent methyltransferase n=1 Tax=Enterococcus larvae TaxID=2794352 RepID=UPI003F2D146E